MAADGGCGETVEQYRAEVERLTQELAEANREKIRAAECGLVVLEENQALKQKYVEMEREQESLRKELEQLQEVRGPGPAPAGASRCSSYTVSVSCVSVLRKVTLGNGNLKGGKWVPSKMRNSLVQLRFVGT